MQKPCGALSVPLSLRARSCCRRVLRRCCRAMPITLPKPAFRCCVSSDPSPPSAPCSLPRARRRVPSSSSIMRSFAIAALVSTVAAAPATVFLAGDAPKCYVLANGETKVEYTGSDIHPSFKCTHTGNVCKCANPHPTHHTGGCMQLDHTDGQTHSISGDCTASGRRSATAGSAAATAAPSTRTPCAPSRAPASTK